jgi:hypothetical protein
MREVGIEYVVARLRNEGAREALPVAIVRQLLREREAAARDLTLDASQLRAGALEIRFRRLRCDRRAIARAVEVEVELYSARALRADSSTSR